MSKLKENKITINKKIKIGQPTKLLLVIVETNIHYFPKASEK